MMSLSSSPLSSFQNTEASAQTGHISPSRDLRAQRTSSGSSTPMTNEWSTESSSTNRIFKSLTPTWVSPTTSSLSVRQKMAIICTMSILTNTKTSKAETSRSSRLTSYSTIRNIMLRSQSLSLPCTWEPRQPKRRSRWTRNWSSFSCMWAHSTLGRKAKTRSRRCVIHQPLNYTDWTTTRSSSEMISSSMMLTTFSSARLRSSSASTQSTDSTRKSSWPTP